MALKVALSTAERLGDSTRIGNSLVELASGFRLVNRMDEALQYLMRAESLNSPASSVSTSGTVMLTNRIAQARSAILYDLGRHAEALDVLLPLLTADRLAYGRRSFVVAEDLYNIAAAHMGLAQFAAATAAVEEAATIFEGCGLSNSERFSNMLQPRAQLLMEKGGTYVEQALDLAQRS